MRSIKEIKKKLGDIQSNKAQTFKKGDSGGYRAWIKAEKLLKWVLNEDIELKHRNKLAGKHRKPIRGKRIKTEQ